MNFKCALGCGILIALTPAAMCSVFYSISNIMWETFIVALSVGLNTAVVLCSIRYFKGVETDFLKEGASIGAFWFIIVVAVGGLAAFNLTAIMPEMAARITVAIHFLSIILFAVSVPIITTAIGYILQHETGR